MSSEYTPTRGRRSPRRGDRRSSRNRGGSRPRQETPAKPQKKTLWQKIVGFFTGGDSAKKPASSRSTTSTGSSSASTAPAKSERPARAAKQPVERPSGFRKPEVVEVTSARIYVGNLSFDASESDLFELFNGVGSVQNVEVVANKYTMKSKGFAFIQMQSVDEAKRAVAELHDKEYMGRKLVVSGAKAVDEKRPERQRQPEQ
ncbi:RNA recognition motif [Terrimicrobium sacchariphilum]|uniref:RNA recognition motif n=1 Tax=Terrimicrobium sacchariphilum TaxID=690879 RepID=A0A146GDB7_TERSA|nr:RNA-binding protein [Terrimicrobium sacchariphilum]GAT34496.1 RNA recognition motif [Terrimicrobium sacchariphilum]